MKNLIANKHFIKTFRIFTFAMLKHKQSNFIKPKFNIFQYGYKSFVFQGASLWNNLPLNVKNSTDLLEFKRYLASSSCFNEMPRWLILCLKGHCHCHGWAWRVITDVEKHLVHAHLSFC